ncbi:SDR family oxidoreductase [soil metagenome]
MVIRRGRTPDVPAVGVTGAADGMGAALLARLAAHPDVARAIPLDGPGAVPLDGLGTVVHLAVSYDAGADPAARRERTVRGTADLLDSALGAGVRRVVLVTSTDVHAAPDGPLPAPEDLPLRAEPDSALTADLLELERLAEHGRLTGLDVVVLRPATLVGGPLGAAYDGVLLHTLGGQRLLAVRGVEPLWQLCHTDDLLSALELAATGALGGTAAVASAGWLTQREVEQLSGRRRLELPAGVALSTAERLHRGRLSAGSPAELGRLLHPLVVRTRRLKDAGWTPQWTAQLALIAYLSECTAACFGRAAVAGATAPGATVALVGTAALVRRARRRRRGR